MMNQYKANRVVIAIVIVLFLIAIFAPSVLAQTPDTVETAAASDVVKTELISWMKSLRNAAETGAAFASEQVPLIIQEKIAYARAYYTFMLIVSVVVVTSFFYFLSSRIAILNKPVRDSNIDRYCDEHACLKRVRTNPEGVVEIGTAITTTAALIAHSIATLISCIVFFDILAITIQVWFAPRLFIVEWLMTFVG